MSRAPDKLIEDLPLLLVDDEADVLHALHRTIGTNEFYSKVPYKVVP